MSPRIIVVCGSGGVGKTTASAAIGINAARDGLRTLVITVDPAKRLAQALGLVEIGHGPTAVDVGGGSLLVSMLDTKAGWDSLIRRHARDAATAERVLRNPLYDNITARFVNSHDYIAMEQINDLAGSEDLDLVVIDTPPSRNALDLLDAPRRMKEFFGGRLLQWLTLPYRSRILSLASKPFLQIADRLLGAQFLGDIAEFFTLLQSMESGFVARARQTEHLLTSERVSFVLVTTAEPAAVREAGFMTEELKNRRLRHGLTVVNRVVTFDGPPEPLPSVEETVERIPAATAAVIDEIDSVFARAAAIAARHAAGVEILRSGATGTVVIEEQPSVTVPSGQSAGSRAAAGLEAMVAGLRRP